MVIHPRPTRARVAPLLRCVPFAVDCWIGVAHEPGRRVVRLAGRLAEAQVPELLTACGGGGALTLDLTDLVSADAAGLETLKRAEAGGASLVGVPGYIRMKLESR